MSFKKFSFITFFLVIFFNLKVYGYPYCPTNKNTTLKSSPSAMGEAVVHVPENYFLQVTARVDSYYVVKYDDKTLFISKDDMGYADILEKKYNPIDKNYELLSEYKTTFDPTEYTRVHNIELASYKTSGELASGAIFSFNTLTGNSNLPANGWQPAEVIESEKSILAAQIENDEKMKNKPAQAIEKIISGKIGKFYEQNCLLSQAFVKDDSVSVGKYLANVAAAVSSEIVLKEYVRYEKGEGLEKKVDNFAEEVASMTK